MSEVSAEFASWRDDVADLRRVVQAADHQLDVAAYDRVHAQFQRFAVERPPHQMRHVAPEYGQDEFLRCVDPEGRATPVPALILDRHHRACERWPHYALWFQAVEDGEGSALLIARWLCHLAGFRHRTVHLMLDHPTLADHVLVQVRGVGKEESPACFDLPVAGHVSGLSTVEQALQRECKEELDLDLAHIARLRRAGSYDRAYLAEWPGFWNVEHHTVYTGRLDGEAWRDVHPPGEEVAGIALFALAQLRALIERFPDRVALGLRDTLPLYR